MKKQFNTTGVCIPEKHYMVDTSDKISRIMEMIDGGNYFVINRPRQYGKTTTLNRLTGFLKTSSIYFPINISFEGISETSFSKEALFIRAFFIQLKKAFKSLGNDDLETFIDKSSIPSEPHMEDLDLWISDLIQVIGKNTVLMIDEVDKSSNNQLFLDFIGMLRHKYLKRDVENEPTFHSVVLAGVHDVKTLKAKIRPDDDTKLNSPWNIAVDFEVDLSFFPDEIATMLKDYAEEQQIKMDISFLADRLYYLTSGYPFLVSLLCKIIDEKILPQNQTKEWTNDDLNKAVQIALNKENTNFDSLIKNLENNGELYEFIFNIIINGSEYLFNLDNPVIHLGRLYGILKEEQGKVRVHNRLYEQRIYNYMSSKLETSGYATFHNITASYLNHQGQLDIKKIILKFQEFMKEQYSTKDKEFIERNGRLLFLAFIRPIINGRGFDFKEVQISEEKRLDIVITFDNRKFIIELKIWHGEMYHREGIKQLCDYLDRQNETIGYLLIYDLRKESGQLGKNVEIEVAGKSIFTSWV